MGSTTSAIKLSHARGASLESQGVFLTSLLEYAATLGELEVVEALLAYGASMEGGNKSGFTPLLAAASSRYDKIAKYTSFQ
jgi:ankyrin repeat protein